MKAVRERPGLVGQVPEQRQGRGPKAPEGLDRHRHEGQGGGHLQKYRVTERDGRKSPPAGNKTLSSKTYGKRGPALHIWASTCMLLLIEKGLVWLR
jgi:hypothetical protein